jgi:DNA invertase Pin-like site-specific DNA recombinase
MRAVIYARVSSDEQADRGLSILTQIKICKEFIKREKWEFTKDYIDEAISGLKSNRPSFLEMLSDAQEKKFDKIVVYSLSRFSRDRFDAITKKKLLGNIGVKTISATEPIDSTTPEGKLLEGIIESINEFYSANLSRGAFRGLKANAEMGFWNGGTPQIGDLVIAIIDNKATFKSLALRDEKYWLEPANNNYQSIELTSDMDVKLYRVKKIIKKT